MLNKKTGFEDNCKMNELISIDYYEKDERNTLKFDSNNGDCRCND